MITLSIKVHDKTISKHDIQNMTYDQVYQLASIISEKEWKTICNWWNYANPHSYRILQ